MPSRFYWWSGNDTVTTTCCKAGNATLVAATAMSSPNTTVANTKERSVVCIAPKDYNDNLSGKNLDQWKTWWEKCGVEHRKSASDMGSVQVPYNESEPEPTPVDGPQPVNAAACDKVGRLGLLAVLGSVACAVLAAH